MDKEDHSRLIIHTTDPLNAEPPLEELTKNFVTPEPSFYIRNHGDIPQIDVNEYRLRINGMIDHVIEFSLEDVIKKFPKHTVMASLQCAGNRRDELIAVAPIPGELPWHSAAIGNAAWSGAPLKEILKISGVKQEAGYVAFMGADDVFRHGNNVGFGASISIDKAMTDDVLLAYEMNGMPLQPTHGFPLRVLVPGYIGARSVKWLAEITLQAEPSKNYFQDHAYKLFPPEANAETVDWNSGVQLSDLEVNCVISSPERGSHLSAEDVTIKGYAIAGGGRKIDRVEISVNGGNSWMQAVITWQRDAWEWTFWESAINLRAGEYEIVARAFDSASNGQPVYPKEIWNFKGYMNNAWHRIKIMIEKSED